MKLLMDAFDVLCTFIFYPMIIWNTIYYAKYKAVYGLDRGDTLAYYAGIIALLLGGIL